MSIVPRVDRNLNEVLGDASSAPLLVKKDVESPEKNLSDTLGVNDDITLIFYIVYGVTCCPRSDGGVEECRVRVSFPKPPDMKTLASRRFLLPKEL